MSIAIYVSDVLERYDPDPVRYFLTAAGPETQDSDFSWAEFLRRNNDELLANWGNLVNRTLTNAQRNFGEVPQPGELTDEDRQALAAVEAGFATVGKSIEEGEVQAGAHRSDAALEHREPVRRPPGAVGRHQGRPRARGDDPVRRRSASSTR